MHLKFPSWKNWRKIISLLRAASIALAGNFLCTSGVQIYIYLPWLGFIKTFVKRNNRIKTHQTNRLATRHHNQHLQHFMQNGLRKSHLKFPSWKNWRKIISLLRAASIALAGNFLCTSGVQIYIYLPWLGFIKTFVKRNNRIKTHQTNRLATRHHNQHLQHFI